MPRPTNRLTARTVATLSKAGLHNDGNGLYLQVAPGGSKSWVYRFMLDRRTRDMGLGSVDLVSLKEARELALAARRLVKSGTDPIEARRHEKQAASVVIPTFQECAAAYLQAHEPSWKNAKHRQQWRNTLEDYASSVFGDRPVDRVETEDILRSLNPLWQTKTETATRVRGRIEAVLDWAKVKGYRQGENPARWRGHLDQLLAKPEKLKSVKHHPALPHKDIPVFISALRQREAITARGLEFLILTAARPGEVTGAKWSEFDLENGLWTVPADRMKGKRIHRVPLSDRALTIVRTLSNAEFSGYVFPGQQADRRLSTDAFRRLLERMDYADITTHGFRSTFRDWVSDLTSFPESLAEAALAHTIGDKVEAAYKRTDSLERRRKLMQSWADYCAGDEDEKVIAFRGR